MFFVFTICAIDCGHVDKPHLTVADRPLAVTYRPVDTLVPSPRNPRTHPKRQVEQIVASIREFGFTNPILIGPDGSVIAGHGRLLAARAMALAEVPSIVLEGLSDAQKRALRLADNKLVPWRRLGISTFDGSGSGAMQQQ